MNRILFTNRYFYLGLAVTLLMLIFYQSITALITGNVMGFVPVVIEFILLFLMALKHAYTAVVLNIWAFVFMGLNSVIKILAKYITQTGNDISGFDINSIYLNIGFITIGFAAWAGGKYFIVDKKRAG